MTAPISDTTQLPLFDNKTIATRFAEFHKKYPRVYLLFERFALHMLVNGHKRIGAKMIMERVRWECATGSQDERSYKINNDFIAHYSRMFMSDHKQYADCFETRILKAV